MSGQPDRRRQHVLVVHPGALGDVLLARPALHLLRKSSPQREIAFLGGGAVGTLLYQCGEVHRMFSAESAYLTELFAGIERLSPPFRDWLEQTDTAVGWLADIDEAATNTLRAVGVSSIQFHSALSPTCHAEHQADRYCEAVGLQDTHPSRSPFLTLPLRIREQGQRVFEMLPVSKRKPLVVIHPGSGSPQKCMESWRLGQVIEWLVESGASPMLLEGPADHALVAALVSGLSRAVPVIREESLSVVAGLLSHAALYIGHDSGITHLAAALGIPTVACFGPTNPRRWAPRGSNVTILTGSWCACLTWRAVKNCDERACLQISPERMIEASRLSLLERPAYRPENA
ncbi:MAG: glycosyltransferase family 9 protein [Nitrospira sp.]|nr:glycosyltransferase family 9 protein [Nitrospira sp.]